MKSTFVIPTLASLVAAHSGVWNVIVDGNTYPARDTRLDAKLGAKRVEWTFQDSGVQWGPVPSVLSPAMACGASPQAPALRAVARAGAEVTVQWSGIIRTHLGPTTQYLAPFVPGASPTTFDWFKIAERGYNKEKNLWANEEMILNDRKVTFQLPSDIKPGMYTLRTELIALHYAARAPQNYPHCFNILINGTGTVTPKGAKIPGIYAAREPALTTSLFDKSGKAQNWSNYVVPGPAKYDGKYEAPVGPKPVVSDLERGQFPPEFQAKYDAFKEKEDQEGLTYNEKMNAAQNSDGHNAVKTEALLMPIFQEHFQNQAKLNKELEALKAEAIKLGIAA